MEDIEFLIMRFVFGISLLIGPVCIIGCFFSKGWRLVMLGYLSGFLMFCSIRFVPILFFGDSIISTKGGVLFVFIIGLFSQTYSILVALLYNDPTPLLLIALWCPLFIISKNKIRYL